MFARENYHVCKDEFSNKKYHVSIYFRLFFFFGLHSDGFCRHVVSNPSYHVICAYDCKVSRDQVVSSYCNSCFQLTTGPC